MKANYLSILFLFCSIIASNEQINHDTSMLDHCKDYNTTENPKICLK